MNMKVPQPTDPLENDPACVNERHISFLTPPMSKGFFGGRGSQYGKNNLMTNLLIEVLHFFNLKAPELETQLWQNE